MPLELPGRNSRMMEPKQTSMAVLVNDVVAALTPLLGQLPFALLGHSMGAWLVYEVAKVLQARGLPLPVKLYVVANRAPHLAGSENDVDQVAPRLGMLPAQQFWCAPLDPAAPTLPASATVCRGGSGCSSPSPRSRHATGPTWSGATGATRTCRTRASAATSCRCCRRTSCCWRRSSRRTRCSSRSRAH
jgi:thioesterase domain-containing protein